ncbi:hypothetical protein DFH11DRAFT_1732144 [Phellopilus nigrolimitatus]|nr:hypothetical protein DFH11DRAFT_1732144 [Phellopilus nigrolimitatus]
MNPRVRALAFLGLVFAHGALTQSGTATIAVPGFLSPDDALQGEVSGTGTDGTTYVVSNVVTDTADVAYTSTRFAYSYGVSVLVDLILYSVALSHFILAVTLVQDATHISEVLHASVDPGDVISIEVQCGFNTPAAGACTMVGVDIGSGTTISTSQTASETLAMIPVPVSTQAADAGSSVSASPGGATPIASTSSSANDSQSSTSGALPSRAPLACGLRAAWALSLVCCAFVLHT